MGIVIATFVIAAVFVGYHASQAPQIDEKAESHNIEPDALSLSAKSYQIATVKADQTSIF